jgi:alpha-L-arabinofuranosidase
MTGIERNSDVVIMASYAPLFVNMNHRHWNPDLINFDGSRWYGLPSYYVQRLFSEHRGDVILPVSVEAEAAPARAVTGAIGVGTWNTQAELKNVKVTAPDGRVLFASDFSKNADGWKQLGEGQWKVENGALKQTAEKEFVRAIAGDRSWADYTLHLQARKLAGREGFLILFHINGDDDRLWWNLGGWCNTKHGIALGGTIAEQKGSIETGKWYDIKIVARGQSIKCYLDGKLVHDVSHGAVSPLYSSATRDEKSGDLILKVVNASAEAVEAVIALRGARQLASAAQAIFLASDKAADENSLAEPTKVAPKSVPRQISGSPFTHNFPGNSFTVLRIGNR